MPPSALVTGALSGVGELLALALARDGYALALHYHADGVARPALKARLAKIGAAAHFVRADLTAPGAPERVVAEAVAALGGLEVVVNSAALFARTPVGATTAAEWDRLMALNVRAPFLVAQAAAPHIERGCIVNVGDTGTAWPGYAGYLASKAAFAAVTRCLAKALAPRIRVNTLALGVLDVHGPPPDGALARVPLRRAGTVHEVEGALRYLLEAEYVNGATVEVDGGRHLQ